MFDSLGLNIDYSLDLNDDMLNQIEFVIQICLKDISRFYYWKVHCI